MKNKALHLIIGLIMMAIFTGCCEKQETEVRKGNYRIVDNAIVFDEPQRVEGQKSVLQFTVDPIENVRIGYIGLGMRGYDAVDRITYIDGVTIVALCDIEPDRVEAVQTDILEARGLPRAAAYTGREGWRELCERDDIDLVYICTNWQTHVEMAVYAMQQGKHVALEVPAATSIEDCWKLVDVAEQTQRHCMMLENCCYDFFENCCYDFFELTALNMAQQGMFGELVHGEGAYIHNLEPFWREYYENWRLEFNQNHAGDVYPTHGLGPLCQAFNIHRGDRMKTLAHRVRNSHTRRQSVRIRGTAW